MDNLERELHNLVGEELHELAWVSDYPINSEIGLWGFFEAFNNHNFKVNLNDSAKEAQFILKNPFEKSPRFLECVLNYNQILEGWRNHPQRLCPILS